MPINAEIYWHPKAVQRAVDRKAPETLSQAGAYVRAVVRNSIKHRKDKNKKSLPYTPPHNHTWLKKSIIFGVAADKKSVLVGPMYLKRGLLNAARLQEFGGKQLIKALDPEKFKKGMKVGDEGPVTNRNFNPRKDSVIRRDPHVDPATKRRVVWVTLRTKTQAEHSTRLYRRMAKKYAVTKLANYPARPYMGPALERSTPKLSKFWANAVRA